MSSRVTDVLRRCRDEHRAALVGYLPVGYPDVDRSIEAMVAMVEAGVDVVEVGIPYSDPVMDGPVIQDAAVQALAGGVRLADAFRAVRAITDAGCAAVRCYLVERAAGTSAATSFKTPGARSMRVGPSLSAKERPRCSSPMPPRCARTSPSWPARTSCRSTSPCSARCARAASGAGSP